MANNGKRERSSEDMAGMIERCLRSMVKRAADGELEVVAHLEELRTIIAAEQTLAVSHLLGEGQVYSWSDIAGQLGITRQGAMRRFASVDSNRRAGGQPAALR